MKHIVFVIGNYKNGGVAMRSTNLANEFAEKGYCCTILVTKEIADNVFFNHHENVDVVSLEEYVSEHASDSSVIATLKKKDKKIRIIKRIRYITRFFPKWDKHLAAAIKHIRCGTNLSVFAVNHGDCIYIPFGVEYFENTFYGTKGINCKIVYAECNPPELEFPSTPEGKKELFNIFSKIDGAVFQTEDELAYFNGYIKNAEVIHNPVKADLPEPFFGERRNIVVNFCRISQQKNIPMMINAFIKFHKEYPDYILEIYGNTVVNSEEELKEHLSKMIVSLNAEKFIKILPSRSDVHAVVRDCAMFVSSSDFEGLSNSMIEAMAIGLPCICTDCLGGGAREMITDGENGLLVPMNDSEALYLAMKRFIEEPKLAEKCASNAAKVRQELSSEKISSKWLDVIEKI